MGFGGLAVVADPHPLCARTVRSCILVSVIHGHVKTLTRSLPKMVGLHTVFRLTCQLAPPETYNYHPLLPPADPENPADTSLETTCSICMEEVNIHPQSGAGGAGEALLGIGGRGYAVAPCHHLFHTKCLSQWMAVKVS